MAGYVADNVQIHPRAEIDADVEIGPFCVVGPNVRIGRGTRLENNVTLMGHVTIGQHNHLYPGVVVGGEPQDISYRGSDTQVIIGDHNVIRESVTINRASEKEDGLTAVGNHNFLMACCHVAHDCKLADHIVMANGTLLGGHVHVQAHASLSGAVAVHHYSSIGSYSFVSGLSRVLHDVPPFMLSEGCPARPRCINVVALKRNEFSGDVIKCLAEAHRLIYRAKVGLDHAREILRGNDQLVPQVNQLLSFIQQQQEGKHGRAREAQESRVTRLPLAVIGAGHLGRIHAKLLAGMSDVELVAVVDPIEAARQQVAAEASTVGVADYRQILHQVRGAVIATPTKYHHPIALELLRQGIHLLVEKPLAATLVQAEELAQTARRHGAILQVGHVERFNPAYGAARASLEDIKFIEAVRAGSFTFRSTDIGVVLDLMIHDLDVVLDLVSSELASVDAIGLAVLGRHEDVAHARLQFECGCVAHLSASRLSAAARRQMQLWGRHGFATVDFAARTASLVRPSQAVLEREIDLDRMSLEALDQLKGQLFSHHLRSEALEVPERNAIADELEDFKTCIRTSSQPRVDGGQACRVIAVAERILDKIAAHRWDPAQEGPVGPLAVPQPATLRGPHWAWPADVPARREAS